MVKAAVMWSFNEPLKIDSLKLKAPREDEVVVKVAAKVVLLHSLDAQAPFILVLALSGKDLNVNDRAVDARRAGQACVFNVAGLFAEDRTQKFLLRGQLGLTLRRHLPDQDRARFDLSSDPDDARVVQIA